MPSGYVFSVRSMRSLNIMKYPDDQQKLNHENPINRLRAHNLFLLFSMHASII